MSLGRAGRIIRRQMCPAQKRSFKIRLLSGKETAPTMLVLNSTQGLAAASVVVAIFQFYSACGLGVAFRWERCARCVTFAC
jgi:hypothetical protein